MDWGIRFLNILLPVLYVSCLFLYGFLFVHPGACQGWRCRLLLRSTLGIHLLYLALVALACGRLPMTNLYEALSFLAFAIAAVYACFSLAGFAVILFSLMVVNLFLTGFHGFS